MRRHLLLALLILGFLLGVFPAAQAASYTFTPIDVPFSGAIATEALGINPRGQIVGAYFDSSFGVHGFLADGGVFTPLDVPFPGAIRTAASGINPRGQIVGFYFDSSFGVHGFLATPDKK